MIHGSPNLYSPEIDIYIRPAEMKDATAIRDIYNYYVLNSIIPEDQYEITIDMAENLIKYAKKEKLPMLVAVHGKFPSTKGTVPLRKGKSRKDGNVHHPEPEEVVLPEQEQVIGFASTDYTAFGLSGSAHGLHRYTIDLKLYVDTEYTRKGVGRNLLDHLIHIFHSGYAFKNACRFINQNNDPIYETGGSGLWHMMNFRIPAMKSNDSTFVWVSQWLKSRFMFLEGACLRSWGRTATTQGPARFVDLHIIQCEALQEKDIEMNF
jgi:L-amino acid N-acyltransferase YncA